MNFSELSLRSIWQPLLLAGGLAFLYASVLAKLGQDWWSDDNYSHGLLVPFVIAAIIRLDHGRLSKISRRPDILLGAGIILFSILLLLAGTLAAELFTQRMSLVLMLAGTVIYFFSRQILQQLVVPFALLLLSIPLPQIIFNKIAFPLQIWASQVADLGIRLWGIPAVRRGNVIEMIPLGETAVVGLEVVEACSGIRSLMTLVTLALILGYFTRERRESAYRTWRNALRDPDVIRIAVLMLSAVPLALLTNAGRVMATGILTYFYGVETMEGVWHDISGSIVFITALILLILVNFGLKSVLARFATDAPVGNSGEPSDVRISNATERQVLAFFIAIMIGGCFINWFQHREEVNIARQPLNEMPRKIGAWEQRGDDTRFDPESEKVLRATDYVMRDYFGGGKRLNLYVGYYASQRSGATYHSPQNCLPGTGWEMTDPKLIEITTPAGRTFTVNRYLIQRGSHKEILIYWYQGRGRATPSEYEDKIYTSVDSVLRRRSDGAMLRIMTPVGKDEARSLAAAVDLTALVADGITPFLPN